MKVGKLKELLKNFEDDWKIELVEDSGFRRNNFELVNISDIGYSDRVILIEIKEDL